MLFRSVIFLAFLLSAGTSYSQWVSQQLPMTVTYYGMHFTKPATGFLVGTNNQDSYILRTTNGGTDWKIDTIKNAVLLSVDFSDADNGIAVGIAINPQASIRVRTTDGGNSWKAERSTASSPFFAIDFASEKDGYIAVVGGTVQRTTNGGSTWTKFRAAPTSEYLVSIHFPTVSTGYVIGGENAGDPQRIYKTVDSGKTWIKLIDYYHSKALLTLRFATETVGFWGGNDGSACIHKTTDGGVTWIKKHSEPDAPFIFGFRTVTESLVYAVGSNGLILRSTDQGETWAKEPVQLSGDVSAISFPTEEIGYVVTTAGSIARQGTPSSVRSHPSSAYIVSIAPNPLKDYATIAIEGNPSLRKTFKLYTLLGQEVHSAMIHNNHLNFHRGGLPAGLYFYKIFTSSEVIASGKLQIRD